MEDWCDFTLRRHLEINSGCFMEKQCLSYWSYSDFTQWEPLLPLSIKRLHLHATCACTSLSFRIHVCWSWDTGWFSLTRSFLVKFRLCVNQIATQIGNILFKESQFMSTCVCILIFNKNKLTVPALTGGKKCWHSWWMLFNFKLDLWSWTWW